MTSAFTAAALRRLSIAALACAIPFASGCVSRLVTPDPPPIPNAGQPVPAQNKVVLADDTQLVADTTFGHIKIEAGPGLRRVFTWNGVRRGAIMEARNKRFAGSRGIMYDGVPPVWRPAMGVTRLHYEEGHRRFKNIDDALIWMQIRRLDYAVNNAGVAVGWRQIGDELQVEVWQFYIDGEQPEKMPGADDAAITISPLKVVPQKMSPVRVSGGSKPGEENWFQRTFGDLFAGDKADDTGTDQAGKPSKSKPSVGAETAKEKDDRAVAEDQTENEDDDDSAK